MATKKHFIFDLDDLLIHTENRSAYMANPQGRKYIAEHIDGVHTEEMFDGARDLLRTLANGKDEVSIVTNSPRDYAKAVLDKHDFPQVRVLGAADKPATPTVKRLVQRIGIAPEDCIMIGDSTRDVLAGHAAQIPTLGVVGGYSHKKELGACGASAICKHSDIEDMIIKHQKGTIQAGAMSQEGWRKVREPEREGKDVDEILALGKYEFGNGNGTSDSAKLVFGLKRIRDITFQELKDQKSLSYFYDGKICRGANSLESFNHIVNSLSEKIEEYGNKNQLGRCGIVAVPHSLPSLCYRSAANSLVAHNTARKMQEKGFDITSISRQHIDRRIPCQSSHNNNGCRTSQKHNETIFRQSEELKEYGEFDTVFIFDDVYTSGSHMKSMRRLCRPFFGNECRYLGLVIAKN